MKAFLSGLTKTIGVPCNLEVSKGLSLVRDGDFMFVLKPNPRLGSVLKWSMIALSIIHGHDIWVRRITDCYRAFASLKEWIPSSDVVDKHRGSNVQMK